jgi:hypothetical protein
MRTVHIISREMFFLSKLVANSFSVLSLFRLKTTAAFLMKSLFHWLSICGFN